jgi:hypothetical protein
MDQSSRGRDLMQSGARDIFYPKGGIGRTSPIEAKTFTDWCERYLAMLYPATNQLRSVGSHPGIQKTLQFDVPSDNFHVAFDVNDNKLVMNLFTYSELDPQKEYNPIIMYQFEAGGRTQVDNHFVEDLKGIRVLGGRADWRNLRIGGTVGERDYEAEAAAAFNLRLPGTVTASDSEIRVLAFHMYISKDIVKELNDRVSGP